MIKILIKYDGNPNSGVNKKIICQATNLIKCGMKVEVYLVGENDHQLPHHSFIKFIKIDHISHWNIFSRFIRTHKIRQIYGKTIDSLGNNDIMYIRGWPATILYYPLNIIKKQNRCRIVVEHQSIEFDQFLINHKYREALFELIFGRLVRKQASAIVGVTDEITKYELTRSGKSNIPHITIGNGFDVNSVPLRQIPEYSQNVIHILCVANVSPWHGLDRLIKGIATYKGTTQIQFHIAGEGAELPSIKEMVNELGIVDQIIFHGFTTGKELDNLFNQCHIAVGSLGIHRIHLNEASILKAREYCARGIPYIIACDDPDFPEDFPCILRFPADENPIDIEKVIMFTRDVYEHPNHPEFMRDYAQKNLDWSIKMKKLKNFLDSYDLN